MQVIGTDVNGNLRVIGKINVKGNNNTIVAPEDNAVEIEGDNNTVILGDAEVEYNQAALPLTPDEVAAYRDYMYVRKIAVYRKTLDARESNKKKLSYKINKLLGIEGR